MAETVSYYRSENITAFPSSNSIDESKILLEENLSAVVTRITTRNYALTEGSFDLSLDPDSTYGQVITVAPGQANIQGYHVITDVSLRVPPPTEITPQSHIVLGMRLARDGSEHIRGDETYSGVSEFKGVWVSYFEYDDPMDPDIFILGYLDWDGASMTNVENNPEKYGRLDAKDIIVEMSDPKHPDVEFLTLQELADNLKDWYVSKIGDDEFGEIKWRTMDLWKEEANVDNWGISAVAKDSSNSIIELKPSLSTDDNYKIEIHTNFDKPFIKLADTELSTKNSDFTIDSVRDIILDSGRTVDIQGSSQIKNKIKGDGNLQTILDSQHFNLNTSINAKSFDFSIDEENLKFLIGDALFSYSALSKYLTLSGVQRFMVANPTEFQSDVRADTRLYLGLTPSTDSYITKNDLQLTSTNYVTKLGEASDGLTIKSKTAREEPQVYIENSKGARVYLRTYDTGSELHLYPATGGKGSIEFDDPSGNTANDNSIYKNPGSPDLHVEKNLYVDGDLQSSGKVWRAVYN